MIRNGYSPRPEKRIIIALFLFSFVPVFLFADLEISSDRWQSDFAEGRERTVLSGNARVTSDRIDVRADEIELYGTDYRYIRASGNLRIEDLERELILRGATLFVDRDRDLMRVQGSAEMEDRENELIVRGGFIEYQGEHELTIVQIGVRILREDLVARSEFARYLRTDNVLELSGLPRIVWRDDEYSAARIVIDLDSDQITLRGDVRAELRTQDAAEDEPPDAPEDGSLNGPAEMPPEDQ